MPSTEIMMQLDGLKIKTFSEKQEENSSPAVTHYGLCCVCA